MAQGSIPVDLFNPGQVFACMGFLEVAEVLLGRAEGRFDWTNGSEACFRLHTQGHEDPFSEVLGFLCEARPQRLAPEGYTDPPPSNSATSKKKKARKEAGEKKGEAPICTVEAFPAPKADHLTLPLRLELEGREIQITHWCDASSRNPFKLFAGQQRSTAIARQMLDAVRGLWNEHHEKLVRDPLGTTVPLGGSTFKFDARKAWTTIDAGYSPDEQGDRVEASPVVEMLAAIGLEHARPDEFETREVRYGVWGRLLAPPLARVALGGVRVGVPMRTFRFTLALAGKNKNVTFGQEETIS